MARFLIILCFIVPMSRGGELLEDATENVVNSDVMSSRVAEFESRLRWFFNTLSTEETFREYLLWPTNREDEHEFPLAFLDRPSASWLAVLGQQKPRSFGVILPIVPDHEEDALECPAHSRDDPNKRTRYVVLPPSPTEDYLRLECLLLQRHPISRTNIRKLWTVVDLNSQLNSRQHARRQQFALKIGRLLNRLTGEPDMEDEDQPLEYNLLWGIADETGDNEELLSPSSRILDENWDENEIRFRNLPTTPTGLESSTASYSSSSQKVKSTATTWPTTATSMEQDFDHFVSVQLADLVPEKATLEEQSTPTTSLQSSEQGTDEEDDDKKFPAVESRHTYDYKTAFDIVLTLYILTLLAIVAAVVVAFYCVKRNRRQGQLEITLEDGDHRRAELRSTSTLKQRQVSSPPLLQRQVSDLAAPVTPCVNFSSSPTANYHHFQSPNMCTPCNSTTTAFFPGTSSLAATGFSNRPFVCHQNQPLIQPNYSQNTS